MKWCENNSQKYDESQIGKTELNLPLWIIDEDSIPDSNLH